MIQGLWYHIVCAAALRTYFQYMCNVTVNVVQSTLTQLNHGSMQHAHAGRMRRQKNTCANGPNACITGTGWYHRNASTL